MSGGSLAGVTVLDLGQIYNGPYATFLMAMAGARVIKIESLGGETLRGKDRKGTATYPFVMLNQNKESVTLDLKSDRGKELFRALVKEADVVLENYGPDAMKRLGLDAPSLLAINPRLIYACGSGYGRSGGQRDYLAMDVTVQAMSGIMSTTGNADDDPLKAGPAICDFVGGVHLYAAVCEKLYAREQTGEGAIVDVAMQDAVLPALASIIGTYYFADQKVPPRTGNRHAGLAMAPYNVYPARDGHVAIICVGEGHWRALLKVLGREDLLTDDDFATTGSRASNMEAVDALVAEWTSSKSREEIADALGKGGVPVAPVRDVGEVMADPVLHERGMLRRFEDPLLGEISLINSPLNVASGNEVAPTPPPALGSANENVYGDMLGLSAEEIVRLREEGVI